MTPAEARASVQALIDDLRYIMGTRPHTDWPAMAAAALEHHQPLISDTLLDGFTCGLQRAGQRALRGLVASNAEEIRLAIVEIRGIEVALEPTSATGRG